MANIRVNKLAIAGIRWSGGGHALLIKGFHTNGNRVIYNDSIDGKMHQKTYHDFAYNFDGDGYWGADSVHHIGK